MKIAMDMDNCLMDTTSVLLQFTNWKFGTNYVLSDVNHWDFWREKGPEYEAAFWQIYDWMDSLRLRRTMPPVDPLACAITKMLSRKHEVNIVTANTEAAREGIEAWLFGHGIDRSDVPVKIIGRVFPGEKVKMDYDLFIDDSPMLIPAMRELPQGSGKLLILLTQPWNAGEWVTGDYNIVRARDWRDIQTILEQRGIL